MEQSGAFTERRTHPRAPLRLPARIRWQGAMGMRVEMTETVDVSREGVLLRRQEACEPLSRVWIIFPFVRGAGSTVQPETPARVARVVPAQDGGFWIALRLENANRGSRLPIEQERRRAERVPFALPIFLRPAGLPWPEESMTHDLSAKGVRFETAHVYAPGQNVIAQIPWGDWAKKGQIHGRVVRVDNLQEPPNGHQAPASTDGAGAIVMSVAVEWQGQGPAPSAAKPKST